MPRRPPEDVLKTSLKTSSRLFLVKAKDHLETIYGLSIYVSFKLQTYYHSITRQTKRRNFENLVFNKYQTRKYFFRELKLFSGFSSQLIPHSQDPFLFLRNTGPIIDFIQLLLLWKAHHKNYPHTHPYIIGKFWFS